MSKPHRMSITWRPGLLEWLRAHARHREITLAQAVNDLVEQERERWRTTPESAQGSDLITSQ